MAAAAATMGALLGLAGTAQAAFQGRDATGAASGSCTSKGPGKCTYFYDTTLEITILNNWSLGPGSWSASAAPGSAQDLAASAGLTASGLAGWVLPTGDGNAAAGGQTGVLDNGPLLAVAVRPGDIAAAVPEPQTYALMLMGVGAVLLAQRRRMS